jgi:DNA-binding CsgD family transcriptional regulator
MLRVGDTDADAKALAALTSQPRYELLNLDVEAVEVARAGQSPSGIGVNGSFVGRQPDLAALDRQLDQARAGTPSLVLVEGPAGIGKTALVSRFLDRSRSVAQGDMLCVLRVSGEEAEMGLPFGVLTQLLAAVPISAADQAAGREMELFRGNRPTDPLAAGAALLHLLGELQRTGTVVLAVDDAQWADRLTLQALTFVLRRLRVDQVLTLVITRDATDPRLPNGLRRLLADDTTLRLTLGGLGADALRILSGQLGCRPLSARAAARLQMHTGGNPLHARELVKQVSAEAFEDSNVPLPAPRGFELLVLARVASCTADAQELTAAASVLGMRCSLHQAAALAKLEDPLPALEQAVAARLLEEQPGIRAVRFPHPMIHSAVYRQLGPAHRTDLHMRAATLVTDESARLRHRARAAVGPDLQLAADLARLGRQRAGIGDLGSAADHLMTASRLSPCRADQEQLTFEALECQLLTGDIGDLRKLTEELQSFAKSDWRSYILARLAFVTGHLDEAEALLRDAWERCNPATAPALAARIAGQLAAVLLLHLRGEEVVGWADLALRLAPDPEHTATDLIRYLSLNGRGLCGRAANALASVARLPNPTVASVLELEALLGRGVLRTWTDDLSGARRDLAGVLAASHDRSVEFRVIAAAMLGQAEYRLGHWDDAVIHCDLAVSVAHDADLAYLMPFCHMQGALVPAARGQLDEAELHARAAQAGVRKDLSATICAALPCAQVARSRGDPDAVITALDPLLSADPRAGINEPGVVVWRDLLADALVATGEYEAADHVLRPLEAIAVTRSRRSAIAAAARARGNLEAARGDHARANHAFQAGLAHVEQIDLPFDRALLQLAYGAFMRRTGKRTAAAAHLRAALDTLIRLDARPDLERCERELAACGLTPTRRHRREMAELTPQERAVAQLVAAGLSNRQAARELVVSVKTVEYHLSHAYAKLRVVSRTQLATRLVNTRVIPEATPGATRHPSA